MKKQTIKPIINLSKNIIKNASVSIFLTILILFFSFTRTSLITSVYDLGSLGLLSIVLGILPYLSIGHGGISAVSTTTLYKSFHEKDYSSINKKLANIKIQYYLFGMIFLFFIFIFAFSFPFLFNNEGTIQTQNQNIPWYISTIFIFTSSIETISTFFIVPTIIILLYIANKSYITNSILIINTIIINAIIIMLFIAQKNQWINLNFILMQIIVTFLLGFKIILTLFILQLKRKKYFNWLKREKITNYKINKKNIYATLTQFLKQFSGDIASIIFLVFALVNPIINKTTIYINEGESNINSFSYAGIFAIFALLASSCYEIIHSIIDASIPSMAKLITFDKKINKYYFNKYQLLAMFVCIYSTSTFLLTMGIGNTILSSDKSLAEFNLIMSLSFSLIILMKSLVSTYDHLLPIFGEFKKITFFSIIKNIVLIIISVILSTILLTTTEKQFWPSGLFIGLLVGMLLSEIIYFFLIKKYINNFIFNSSENYIWKKNILALIYIVILYILMALIYGFCVKNYEALIDINIGYRILIVLGLSIITVPLTIIDLKIFRTNDFNYYHKEFLCIYNHKIKSKKHLIE